MRSPSLRIERARPLLGTTVSIRVEGLAQAQAHDGINEAFAEIALVHRLMSFQERDSDISRLNHEACVRTVDVHPATFQVLYWARRIAEVSKGAFDITIAPKLVGWGLLAAPASRHEPDPEACWRDVELGDDYSSVRFRRPLWIDVSGIAKGYAVDRAIENIQRSGARQACVNAGGDLRVIGPEEERVALQLPGPTSALPVLIIQNAAVASSSGHVEQRLHKGEMRGPHVDAQRGVAVPANHFASVVAETCLIADALTKPVLALSTGSEGLLREFRALAHFHDPALGWRHLP
jgi:thiamine biosynthesis lipoprotein